MLPNFGAFLERFWLIFEANLGGVSQTPSGSILWRPGIQDLKDLNVAPGHQFVTRSNSTKAVVAKAFPKTGTILVVDLERIWEGFGNDFLKILKRIWEEFRKDFCGNLERTWG